MPERLLISPRLHRWILIIASLIGAVLIITIRDGRAATITFLSITAAESGIFILIFGFRASWRGVPAARAVFWAVLGYCGVSTSELAHLFWSYSGWWWTHTTRELIYLCLCIAGLNLVFVLNRILGPPDWVHQHSHTHRRHDDP